MKTTDFVIGLVLLRLYAAEWAALYCSPATGSRRRIRQIAQYTVLRYFPADGRQTREVGRCLYHEFVAGAIKIGVAGWSYKEWVGNVYPASLKSSQRLGYLAEFFDLVEINSSFYGPIQPGIAREWCRTVAAVNRNFVFTAKLYRGFTHSPVASVESTSAQTIRPQLKDERDTKGGFDALASAGRLGAVLAQFPVSFKLTVENRGYLERLLSRFSEYPLVVEIRHASWNQPEILNWLASLGVGLCNIDQPLIGRAMRPSALATSAVGYIRLHGRNYEEWFADTNARDRYDYLYSENELEQWEKRAEEVAQKAAVTYVIANNHNLGKAAVNALELIHILNGGMVRAPASLVEKYPQRLADIAIPGDSDLNTTRNGNLFQSDKGGKRSNK